MKHPVFLAYFVVFLSAEFSHYSKKRNPHEIFIATTHTAATPEKHALRAVLGLTDLGNMH